MSVKPFALDVPTGLRLDTSGKPRTKRVLLDYAKMAARLQEIRAELCRRRFSTFFRWAFVNAIEPGTRLEWAWHLDAICDHLQWIFQEWRKKKYDPAYVMAVQNLLINIPPRSLKSKIISVAFSAWCWLHEPDMTFFSLGVPKTALNNARESLELVQSSWYREWFRPAWVVDPAHCAATDFRLAEILPDGTKRSRGGRNGAGWSVGITGRGADCILPDDPHDADDVHSDEMRESVLNKWDLAIWNRVRDLRHSIRVGTMQRLREDDWSGHVLRKAASDPGQPQWCHLRIPLRYRSSKRCVTPIWADPRTIDGEVMDPVRFTDVVVKAELLRLGPYGFSGQYDQDPEPVGGGLFKRHYWRFFRFEGVEIGPFERPEGCVTRAQSPAIVVKRKHRSDLWDFDTVCISVDASFKRADEEKKGKRSEVGIGILGIKGADRFVIHDGTAPMDALETVEAIEWTYKQHPMAAQLRLGMACKLIEEKANGIAIINLYKSKIPGLVPFDPGQDSKEARAFSTLPLHAAGNVYMLDGAEWMSAMVSQHAGFPLMSRNDRVDWLAQALIYFGVGSAVAAFLQMADMS